MQLSEVGRPRLSKRESGGWHAGVEFPAPRGVSAQVTSEFNHETPEDALRTVIDRLGGLREMISVPAPQLEQTR